MAAAITMLALAAAQPALSARPQVLSYTFVVVFTVAWLGSMRDGRPRWWLVPLTWLWAIVHGMWPLAILIGVVGAAGALIERRHALRRRLRLFLVPLLCALAAAVTPVGPALYGAVVQVGANAEYFTEWASPDFRHPMAYLTAGDGRPHRAGPPAPCRSHAVGRARVPVPRRGRDRSTPTGPFRSPSRS